MNNQYLIIGLGNIGKKYEKNRHNIGFLILDHMLNCLKDSQKNCSSNAYNFEFNDEKKFFGAVCEVKLGAEKFFFLKPSTFMNLSGKSAAALKNFYKIDIKNILVIHDELDFSCIKKIKFKQGGGDGGHNGLKSLTLLLSSPEYLRLRVGIGRPACEKTAAANILENNANAEAQQMGLKHMDVSSYVLADLNECELKESRKIAEILAKNLKEIFLGQKERDKILNSLHKS